MQHKINSQGVAMPLVLGAIALITIIVAVAFVSQNSGSPAEINTDEMVENNTNDTKLEADDATMEKKDDAMMEKNTNESAIEKPNENAMMEKKDEGVMGEKQTDAMGKPAPTGYVAYSSQAYADAKDQQRVLFFHATWCPTCKAANADFTANASKIPSNVVVFKTDYDAEVALKSKYGITYQHTFVQVDAGGNAVAKWNGGGVNQLLKSIK